MTGACKGGLQRPFLSPQAAGAQVTVVRCRKEGRPRRAAHTGLMRRLGIVIIVFLLGCSFQSGATQEASLARGRDLLKHGSYKEAIAVFTALVDKNSKDGDAIEGLVLAQIETGDYPTAEKRTRDFLNTQPAEVSL